MSLFELTGEAPILRAAVRAENAAPGFSDRACAAVMYELRRQPEGRAPGELLVDLARLHPGCDRADGRSYGGVFKRLAREGRIRQAGLCERRKGHGSPGGRIWQLTEAQC